MEVGSNENSEGKIDNSSKNLAYEDVGLGAAITANPKKQLDPSAAIGKVSKFRNYKVSTSRDTLAELNMEVPITPDEVMQAGGYGATDDISNFLTPGSDSTDFEVKLSRVQDYEELEDDRSTGQSHSLENRVVFIEMNARDTENVKGNPAPTSFVAVNMEASVTSDEMMRAGGFGATDNISSFLPVASDFTDFEAHLRDDRDYEDCGKEVDRPGLGWSRETR